ncbi:MAG: hypothetical protein K0Q94_4909 [Paenibacillus sp.]|jgi:hypothetical protein|nr:hypothetical protein [Paenibacillus sp.]
MDTFLSKRKESGVNPIPRLADQPLDPSPADDNKQDEQYQNYACRSKQASNSRAATASCTANVSHGQSSSIFHDCAADIRCNRPGGPIDSRDE